MEAAAGDGVGEKGELEARAAGPSDEMELRGVAETRGDEHFAANGMPVVERGGAVFEVAPRTFGQRGGDFGDAVHDEVFAGSNIGLLGGRGGQSENRTQD